MSDALVFQSDFGLVDGAVAAMYGVALDVDKDLKAPHEAGREKSANILSYIQITGEADKERFQARFSWI